MNSRERFQLSLRHKQPDRVPIDFWSTAETDAKLLAHLHLPDRAALLDHFDVDFRFIEGPSYVGPKLSRKRQGSSEDIWGVPRRREYAGEGEKRQSYTVVVESPLAEAESVEDVLNWPRWPSPDWLDYSPVKAQCKAIHDAGRVAVFMGDRLNRIAQLKPAEYLRGMENVLMDMAMNPDLFMAIVGKLVDFYSEYLRRMLVAADGGIDLVFTGDDFGTQRGMICSPAMWREMLLPGFATFCGICKEFGVPVAHHTCGSVRPIIGDMIDAGLDMLNPLQPDTAEMDHGEIKAEFGDRLAFHGAIGIQRSLPYGSPEQVRQEVREAMANLAGGGGYIACTAHNIQADVPVENTLAMVSAYREFGRYA